MKEHFILNHLISFLCGMCSRLDEQETLFKRVQKSFCAKLRPLWCLNETWDLGINSVLVDPDYIPNKINHSTHIKTHTQLYSVSCTHTHTHPPPSHTHRKFRCRLTSPFIWEKQFIVMFMYQTYIMASWLNLHSILILNKLSCNFTEEWIFFSKLTPKWYVCVCICDAFLMAYVHSWWVHIVRKI